MSTKRGVNLHQLSTLLVAAKEYGVVITSPTIELALSASISPVVPLLTKDKCSTPK